MENRINKFYDYLMKHENLLEEIKAKKVNIQTQQDLEAFIESVVVPIANKSNFDITAKEFLEYESKNLQILSEMQLSDVSGGVGMKNLAISGISSIMLFCSGIMPAVPAFAAGDNIPGESPSTASTSTVAASTSKVVGLQNIGNSCYFNSALQQLYSCEDLRESIKQVSVDVDAHGQGVPQNMTYLYNISKLFREMSSSSNPISKDALTKYIKPLVDPRGDGVDFGLESILNEFGKSDVGRSICNKIRMPSVWIEMVDLLNPNLETLGTTNLVEQAKKIKPSDNERNIFEFIRFMMMMDGSEAKTAQELPDDLILCFPFRKEDKINLNVCEFCDTLEISKTGAKYALESLSVDTGGHYITFTKNASGKWVCIDDASVSEISTDFGKMIEIANSKGVISSLTYSKKC